ncbi:MAG: BTAD domain-containing putative transcriptional regulator, partial [Nitriliruptorales bacterium]|nr:BTAD domain-containing putative transcriptional regulator [Nitriliruptorales bacterium]
MEFRVLGPLEVVDDDGEPVAIGGPKPRTLIAVLALDVRHAVSSDRIIDAIWGDDPPDRASAALQVHVSKLRSALGEGTIRTRRPGYLLDVPPDAVDHVRFERHHSEGLTALGAAQFDDAVHHFEAALALWRGAPLADLPDRRFADATVAAFTRTRETIERGRIEAELRRGNHEAVLTDVSDLLAANPLDESVRAMAMLAHYRSGRTASALELYDEGRRELAEELGMDPGPELEALHRQILDHDPSLAAEAELPHELGGTTTQRRSLTDALRPVLQLGERTVELERPVVTLGRHPDRVVHVEDPKASRRHAEIRRIGELYIIRDQGSTNGTIVNGAPVLEAELADGDEI